MTLLPADSFQTHQRNCKQKESWLENKFATQLRELGFRHGFEDVNISVVPLPDLVTSIAVIRVFGLKSHQEISRPIVPQLHDLMNQTLSQARNYFGVTLAYVAPFSFSEDELIRSWVLNRPRIDMWHQENHKSGLVSAIPLFNAVELLEIMDELPVYHFDTIDDIHWEINNHHETGDEVSPSIPVR
jgi:hypothetical protein